MSARTGFDRVTRQARLDCFAIIEADLKKHLPDGWSVWLAVGWGLSVHDINNTIVHPSEKRMPKRLLNPLRLAADFMDTYGAGNEVIKK